MWTQWHVPIVTAILVIEGRKEAKAGCSSEPRSVRSVWAQQDLISKTQQMHTLWKKLPFLEDMSCS